MIYDLGDMIGNKNTQSEISRNGRSYWVRAVPLPYYESLVGRFRDAFEVFVGKAYAIKWPEAGELEDSLKR